MRVNKINIFGELGKYDIFNREDVRTLGFTRLLSKDDILNPTNIFCFKHINLITPCVADEFLKLVNDGNYNIEIQDFNEDIREVFRTQIINRGYNMILSEQGKFICFDKTEENEESSLITYEVILGEDAYQYVLKSRDEVYMDAETENKIKEFDNDDLVFVEKDLSLPLPISINRVAKINRDFVRKFFEEEEENE